MPGHDQALPDRLGRLVRERGGPATEACVLSPFYDHDSGHAYAGTTALLAALTDRGQRAVEFLVAGETLPDGRMRLRAPRSLLRIERKTATFEVFPVREDAEGEMRPLHAKSVWLWNDRWHVYMIGSSNFTGAGLGLPGRVPNVEANLAYLFPEDGPTVRTMEETLPPCGDRIKELDAAIWEPVEEAYGEEGAGRPILPPAFEEALFTPSPDGGTLTLRFRDKPMPIEWEIQTGDGPADPEGTLLSAREWRDAGSPPKLDRTWRRRRIPTALDVLWRGPAGEALSAAWPVNVTDLGSLPPPEDLRNLPLDTLVEILGSRRPLHEAVVAAKRKARGAGGGLDGLSPEIDPHRKVRTETFLLQRTRRVARAVEQLVARLSRPVPHPDALAWRLRGPVGPLALARAIAEEARSPGEAAFLLVDLTLALRRLDVRVMASGIGEEAVRAELEAVRREIEELARGRLAPEDAVPAAMRDYVARAFQEAQR
jgi:hypothetical protein